MSRKFPCLLAIAVASLIFNVQAQDGQIEEQGNEEVVGSLPYEVIVRPRVTRAHLRDLITKVEDDFFARFNELNIDDAYDIVCYKHTPIMSHISVRVCEPLFLLRSRNLNASETTMLLSDKYSKSDTWLFTDRELRRENRTDFGELQNKMEEFTRADAEFRSIGNALAELKARIENFGDE